MPHHNLLARHRRGRELAQHELGTLFGVSQSTLSRCERGAQHPSIEIALGCQVVFNEEPRVIFPDFYAEIEEAVIRRGAGIYQASEQCDTDRRRRRCEWLAAVMERANPTPA